MTKIMELQQLYHLSDQKIKRELAARNPTDIYPLERMYRNEMVFLYLEPMKAGLLMLRNRCGTVKPKDFNWNNYYEKSEKDSAEQYKNILNLIYHNSIFLLF